MRRIFLLLIIIFLGTGLTFLVRPLFKQDQYPDRFYVSVLWSIKPTVISLQSASAHGDSYLIVEFIESEEEGTYDMHGQTIYRGIDWSCEHPTHDCEFAHEFNGQFIGTAEYRNGELIMYPTYPEDASSARPYEIVHYYAKNGTLIEEEVKLYQLELSLAETKFFHPNGYRIPLDEGTFEQTDDSTAPLQLYTHTDHTSVGHTVATFYYYPEHPEQSAVTPADLLSQN